MGIVPYLVVTGIAAFFSLWFWNWGVAQGPVGSIEEVPAIIGIENIVGAILFFGSGWLALRKNLQNPFLVLAGLSIWYTSVVILGNLGFFAARPLFAPNIVLAFILLFIVGRKILSSASLQDAFARTPLQNIFLVQTFRVMGVAFLTLYAMKVLPGQFAVPTGIGDVVVGLLAPIVAYIYTLGKSFSKPIAIIWNYLGIADLTMSITLGVLTYPEPLHVIQTQISNLPIALYPLVIIPIFAVPFSVLLHIFSLRELKKSYL